MNRLEGCGVPIGTDMIGWFVSLDDAKIWIQKVDYPPHLKNIMLIQSVTIDAMRVSRYKNAK